MKQMTARQTESVLLISPSRIRPFADQPREYFDKDELVSLELSIKQRGQLQPVMVREIKGESDHEYELVDGQRRWHACMSLGLLIRGVVINPESEEDQFEISVAANFQRAGHTPMEIAKAVTRMMDPDRGGRTAEYVATLFGKSGGWVYLQARLMNLVPEIQAQLEPGAKVQFPSGEFPLQLAYEIARMPADKQLPMLQEIIGRRLMSGRAIDLVRRTLSEGKPERRFKASQHEHNLTRFVRGTIQRADLTLDRLDSEQFRIMVEMLVKTKKLAELKESVMTAIGRLETIHRRLTDVGSSVKVELDRPAPKPQPEPEKPKKLPSTFVYSIPMLCPKCHTKNARFRRRSDANVATDFWTCDIKGCQLKISHYSIKVDRSYQVTGEKTA